MRTLTVFLHGERTGQLTLRDSGRMSFQYDESWLSAPHAVPLSHSLPFRRERFAQRECAPFFAGVLPEGNGRATIARLLGMSVENDFALLEAIGGECAGAVCLLPADVHADAQTNDLRPLTPDDLGELLRELPRRPLLAGTDGYRMSLAGAQPKIALTIHDGQAYLPLGGAPSTHILKPADPNYGGVVFNEAFCLSLAAACGLHAASCEVGSAAGVDYLLIERLDRERDATGQVVRLHQEDFCQALGVRSEFKYQNEGGPDLTRCFELARTLSGAPVIDIGRLLDAVVFNAVVGNHDAHAKNFAWLRYRDGRVRLAPIYDLVCTAAYPMLTTRMAMRVGRARESDRVGPVDLRRFATDAGLNPSLVLTRAREIGQAIRDNVDQVAQCRAAFRPTAAIVQERAEHFERRLRSDP